MPVGAVCEINLPLLPRADHPAALFPFNYYVKIRLYRY